MAASDFAAAGSAGSESQRGVIGDYQIQYEILGQGSNATVRLGHHIPTGEKVAVKIIDISNSQLKERAYLEAQVLRKFNNESIIRLLAVYELGQFLYLVLEYLSGGDLGSYIERYGRLEEFVVRNYLRQIVKALEDCHKTKVAHHDIKLENILIDKDNNSLRLIDFGLCTIIDDHSPITNFAGSPLFMSPEVFSLQPHDESVDIWSLGVCLYKMLTDLYPFMAESYSELEERVLFDDVVFPMNMGLSPAIQDLIRRMLTKDPKYRINLEEIKSHVWYLMGEGRTERKERSASGVYYWEELNVL
eukprot:TRINITY_DN9720_c0_g1_i1.p1 TRINITY_DN9720_c0_g1~~TRINITY_DN9720_c0_g1_i1.p1  ORF type:complete len:303 (-),score=42.70 TRINITY_DN9720_c0_g1_i1:60-968(-)